MYAAPAHYVCAIWFKLTEEIFVVDHTLEAARPDDRLSGFYRTKAEADAIRARYGSGEVMTARLWDGCRLPAMFNAIPPRN